MENRVTLQLQERGLQSASLNPLNPHWHDTQRHPACRSTARRHFGSSLTDQKRSFTAICPMRGSLALVTSPNVAVPKVPLGTTNCAWLKMLKNSARN